MSKFKISIVILLLLPTVNIFLLAKESVHKYINCTTGTIYSTDQIKIDQDQQYVNDFDKKDQEFKKLCPNFVSQNRTISLTDLAILRQIRNARNQQYIEKYGVSYDMLFGSNFIKGLYQYDFEEVVKLLLDNKNISKDQGIAIFEGYCNKRWFNYEKKEHFGNELKNGYDLKEKIAKEQEKIKEVELKPSLEKLSPKEKEKSVILLRDIQALRQKYVLPDTYLCQGVCGDYVQDRQQALQETINTNFVQQEKKYKLSFQTVQYLQSKRLDCSQYTTCCGTVLQQELHAEICQILDKVALQEKYLQFPSGIINFADAACEQNKLENISATVTLNDIAWTLAAIPIGIFDSAKDLVTLPFNLPEIAFNLGRALYFVLETTALNLPAIENISDIEILIKMRDERNDLIKQCVLEMVDKASWHDRIKFASRCGADIFLPGKIGKAIGSIFAGIALQSRTLRNLENAASMMEQDYGLLESLEEAKALEIVTKQGFKEQVLVELMEAAENHIGKNYPKCIFFGLSESETLLKQQEIISEIELIMQDFIVDSRIFAQNNKNFLIEFERIEQDFLIDLHHIFIPKVKPRWNYILKYPLPVLEEFGLTGWHYGGLDKFEQAGFLKIIKKIIKNDCIYVEFSWKYGSTIIKKSFYPQQWSREKILYNIKEAVKNPYTTISKGDPAICLEKKLYSRIENGIEIITYLKRESPCQKWCIKSSFINKEWILL